MAHLGKKIKVKFADQGQDLLWFEVDLTTDQVTAAGPFHNDLYKGKYVFCPRSLYPGMYLEYSDTPIVKMHQKLTAIKYQITEVEKV